MKNKGFTLIELLAVIVILAIIALIATPIILGIINDARESAKERSAELVVANVKTAYSVAYAKTYSGGTVAGEVPKLSEVWTEVNLQNATKSSTGYVITTTDLVQCTLGEDDSATVHKLTVTCLKKAGGAAYTGATTKVETTEGFALTSAGA